VRFGKAVSARTAMQHAWRMREGSTVQSVARLAPSPNTQFVWNVFKYNFCFAPTLVTTQKLQVNSYRPPGGQRSEQAARCSLQRWRLRAKVRGLSRAWSITGSSAVTRRMRSRRTGRTFDCSVPASKMCDKSSGDFGRYRRELNGQSVPRATQIGSCMYNARADNTDADFACSGHGEHEDIGINASGRTELVARDDRRR